MLNIDYYLHLGMRVLVFTFLLLYCGCKKKDSNQSACGFYPALYSKVSYPVGVAVDILKLNSNVTYNQIVIDQFNSVTPENEFKAEHLHP